MNVNQATDFEQGVGGFFTAGELLLAIQGIGATVVFLYVSWLCLRAYDDYGREYIKAQDMIIVWARGVFVLMLLLYLLII